MIWVYYTTHNFTDIQLHNPILKLLSLKIIKLLFLSKDYLLTFLDPLFNLIFLHNSGLSLRKLLFIYSEFVFLRKPSEEVKLKI